MIERLGSSAEIWVHFVRKFSGRHNVQSVTPVNPSRGSLPPARYHAVDLTESRPLGLPRS